MKRFIVIMLTLFVIGCTQTTQNTLKKFELNWTYSQFFEPISIGVQANDKYVACVGINGIEIALIDESNGSSLWHLEQDEKPTNAMNFQPIIFGNKLITYSCDSLKAWELKTGYSIWDFQTESSGLGPASFYLPSSSGSRIFSGTASGFFYCIDIGSGLGAWREKSRFEGFGQSVTWNDKVIIRTLSGRIEARNKATGKLIWKNENWSLPDDSLTIDENFLYLAGPNQHITFLDPATGKFSIDINSPKKPINGHLRFSPKINSDKIVVLEGKKVTSYNKKTVTQSDVFELSFEPESFNFFDDLCLFTFESQLLLYNLKGKEISVFREPFGDNLNGSCVSKNHILTWSPRSVYAIKRF